MISPATTLALKSKHNKKVLTYWFAGTLAQGGQSPPVRDAHLLRFYGLGYFVNVTLVFQAVAPTELLSEHARHIAKLRLGESKAAKNTKITCQRRERKEKNIMDEKTVLGAIK